jgi:hypothetical protein
MSKMNEVRQFKGFKSTQSKTDQHIISLAFMFGLFMPNGTLFYYLVPVVIFLLGLRYSKFNNSVFSFKYILLALILISFILFAITNTDKIDAKGLLRNIVLFELILFFPFAKNVRIPNTYLYFTLIFIFISQISYMLGIDTITSFFNRNYPYDGDYAQYQSDYLKSAADRMSLVNRDLRLGGLFTNPNQCARYLNIIFAVFLIENYNAKLKPILPFLIIYVLSIIATGSRTGFFITIVVFSYYLYIKSTNKKNASKYILILLVLFFVSGFIYLANSELAQTLRFLDFDEGLEKSLFTKIGILTNYLLENANLLKAMFGNFSNDGVFAIQFDSEWGELVYRYGLIFIFSLILFYLHFYRRTAPRSRLIFFILLWMISGTVLISYRASFVFLLALSKYSYNLMDKKKLKPKAI